MGSQVSTIKAAAGKLAPESKRKGNKVEKAKIGILAFEVANVMSKSMQLWQSLSDHEILRLRTEVIKAEGVLNLVSDNEAVLLSLACMEKLQDLTAVASAVARLGQRCQEPALQGFEHVYNDVLKQSIDVRALEFPCREMESKVKKMERYIASTASLYQELEILADLEQACRRLQDDEDGAQSETLNALEQKAMWQRQEIKCVRDLSLWNRTYDKVVGLLARTVCTIHGRIVGVFGSPMLGLSQTIPLQPNGESCNFAAFRSSYSSSSQAASLSPRLSHPAQGVEALNPDSTCSIDAVSQPATPPPGSSANADDGGAGYIIASLSSQNASGACELRPSPSPNLSSGPHITQTRSSFVCYSPNYQNATGALPGGSLSSESSQIHIAERSQTASLQAENTESFTSALLYVTSHSMQPGHRTPNSVHQNGRNMRLLFDPKSRHQMAPWSTLGGAALALHYANVIIIIEKMIQYPHLIAHDAREDLYRMLPNTVRMALRSRLRATMKLCERSKFDSGIAADWKEALERILGWLAPLAHNMIRWQSEHNFEQQQVVSRTNVLLLQTLYFADLVKTEAAITELLVGLNYICGYEQGNKCDSLIEYTNNKDSEEYLDWRF